MGREQSSYVFPGYNDQGNVRMIRGVLIDNLAGPDESFMIESVRPIFGAGLTGLGDNLEVMNLYDLAATAPAWVLAVYSAGDSWWEAIVVES
jgi:hypothetical protein